MTRPSAALDLAGVDPARLSEICERYGIVELDMFGSVARGDATEGSDVDLLYIVAPDRSLGFSINRLEDELAELFGRSVDLVSKHSLHPLLRDHVLREARPLHAA